MNRPIENNTVTLSGKIMSKFRFSHEIYGEGFYTAMLASDRTSGIKDILPIMVSERLADVKKDWTGKFIKISGQFRSYNQHDEDRNRLILSVFAREFEADESENGERGISNDKNSIFLDGYICKQPIYRKTPLGRDIAEIILAVNRPYGKSDYIPCIAWGRNAGFAESFGTGARMQVYGRIQSRKYQKKISDNEAEVRVAYEVSISKLSVGI